MNSRRIGKNLTARETRQDIGMLINTRQKKNPSEESVRPKERMYRMRSENEDKINGLFGR